MLKAKTRKKPKMSRVTATALTAAKVIHVLRRRLLKASRPCRNIVSIFITVFPLLLVADDHAVLDGDDPLADRVDDLLVVGRHHDSGSPGVDRSEEHTSELQSRENL